MIWFKKSELIVDCFTYNSAIHEYFPIEKYSSHIPDWWKSIPKNYVDTNKFGLNLEAPTIKRCIGLHNLYSTGMVIPLWSDLIVQTEENGNWLYQYASTQSPNITTHDIKQHGNSFKGFIHLKLVSPWLIREKTGVNWLFTQPSYNMIENLSNLNVLPGVVDFKYQASTNINVLVKAGSTVSIKNSQPVVHLIPLSDKNIKIKNHLLSEEEYRRFEDKMTYGSSFLNRYKTNKELMNRNKG
jgi:hypothetical protein